MTSNTQYPTTQPQAAARPKNNFWTEVPGIAILILNAFWISGWYAILTQSPTSSNQALLLLAAIMPASYYLARLFNRWQNQPLLQRIAYLIWIFGSLLISLDLIFFTETTNDPLALIQRSYAVFFNPQQSIKAFWHVFAFLLAILRSILLARNPATRDDVSKAFKTAVIMLLLSGLTFGGEIPTGTLPIFYGLLFTGLLGLSTAHFVDLAESSGGRLPVSGSRWVAGVLIASTAFVLLAIIAGWLIDETIAGYLTQAALALFMLFAVLITLIFSPLLVLLLEVSNRIGQALFANSVEILPQIAAQQAIEDLRETSEENVYLLTSTVENTKGIIMLVTLGVIALVAILLVRWKPWERRLNEEDGISSSASRRLRPDRGTNDQPGANLFTNIRSQLAAARIRDVYRRLMLLCERIKHPRPAALTPLEFLPQMKGFFPDCDRELETITNAYLKIRYGELPESNEEISEVMAAWATVRKMGGQLRKSQK